MRQTQLERAKRALVWDGQRLNTYRQHMDDDEQSRHNLQILTAVFYASLDYVWELQTRCGRRDAGDDAGLDMRVGHAGTILPTCEATVSIDSRKAAIVRRRELHATSKRCFVFVVALRLLVAQCNLLQVLTAASMAGCGRLFGPLKALAHAGVCS